MVRCGMPTRHITASPPMRRSSGGSDASTSTARCVVPPGRPDRTTVVISRCAPSRGHDAPRLDDLPAAGRVGRRGAGRTAIGWATRQGARRRGVIGSSGIHRIGLMRHQAAPAPAVPARPRSLRSAAAGLDSSSAPAGHPPRRCGRRRAWQPARRRGSGSSAPDPLGDDRRPDRRAPIQPSSGQCAAVSQNRSGSSGRWVFGPTSPRSTEPGDQLVGRADAAADHPCDAPGPDRLGGGDQRRQRDLEADGGPHVPGRSGGSVGHVGTAPRSGRPGPRAGGGRGGRASPSPPRGARRGRPR